MTVRRVKRITQSQPAVEGAGVRLRRAFGFGKTDDFDPFLLLDDFRNDVPADYAAGFPWHPHRGIETITYMLAGTVEHRDSLGNHGSLGAGDVQWMTAGSGIMHQEMPKGDAEGRMHGFQLWANLPASLKMTTPRYQDIAASDIPEVVEEDGTRIRIICGQFMNRMGPVEGIAADPSYLDISVPPSRTKRLAVESSHNAFVYVFAGSGGFEDPEAHSTTARGTEAMNISAVTARDRFLVLFEGGDEIAVRSGPEGVRFLLVSGIPLREAVAWHGPIVMNTEEQLREAIEELRDGTFIRHK